MSDPAVVSQLLRMLYSANFETRLQGVQRLAALPVSSPEIVQALEQAALRDANPDVRSSALNALGYPAHQRVQWERVAADQDLPETLVARLLAEIDGWQRDGLITEQVAGVLKQRYPLAEPSAPPSMPEPEPQAEPVPELVPEPIAETAAQPAPPALWTSVPAQPVERPTLSQVLLGETAIRVALYLGAFFVVSAAFITAALVEVARLPILSITTLALLGAALGLSRRLPTAGFVLFIAGGLMLPIDAGVLVDLSKAVPPGSDGLWAAAFGISSVVWALGTWRFDSRLLAFLTFASLDLAVCFALLPWLEVDAVVIGLGLAAVALGCVAAAWMLRRGGAGKYFVLLFVSAQLQASAVAGTGLVIALVRLIPDNAPAAVTWWNEAVLWLTLAVFYAASDLVVPPLMVKLRSTPTPVSLLRGAATLCLLVFPLMGVGAFSPGQATVAAVAWGWGAILAAGSEGLSLAGWERIRGYGIWALIMSIPGMALGLLIAPSVEARLGYWLGSAVILTALAVRRPRWPVWSLGLIGWTAAYLTVFALPAVAALNVFAGFILVAPMAVYLTSELLARKRLGLSRGWTSPVLVMGLLFVVATGLSTLFGFANRPGDVAITFLVMGAFLMGYAILDSRVIFWIGALVSWTATYLTVFAIPAVAALHLFGGYILVAPMAIFLTLELLARKRWSLGRNWTLPVLVLGVLFVAATFFTALYSFSIQPGDVAITFLVMAVFLTGYAVLDSRVIFWMGALGVAYLAYVAGLASIRLSVPLGWAYLPPALVYLVIYLVIRRRVPGLKPAWWQSALAAGVLAGGVDILLALVEKGARAENIALVYLAWAVVLGVMLAVESEKVWWWTGALVMACASYGAASRIDAVQALPIFAGFIYLLPALALLSVELAARLRLHAEPSWTLPPLALGGIATLVTIVVTVGGAGEHPERGIAIFAILAVYLAIYALLAELDLPAYLSAAAGLAAFTYIMAPWRSLDPNWAAPYAFLAAGYFALGLGLGAGPMARLGVLARAFRWSGLGIGALAVVIVFVQPGDFRSVIGAALVATCVAVEAFRRRNVWLGYPANLCYLVSYYLALRVINVTEPQFFTIGAASLGLIMHYLLTRNRSTAAAFATGLISQLLLQGTSYIQMVSTQALSFFAALFFESLAIMVYGLVIRSRSLLFIPIGFLIVGTATVAFTFLKGLSTAAIIGVTGFVLLLLGILALLMRERLVRLVAVLNTWEP